MERRGGRGGGLFMNREIACESRCVCFCTCAYFVWCCNVTLGLRHRRLDVKNGEKWRKAVDRRRGSRAHGLVPFINVRDARRRDRCCVTRYQCRCLTLARTLFTTVQHYHNNIIIITLCYALLGVALSYLAHTLHCDRPFLFHKTNTHPLSLLILM